LRVDALRARVTLSAGSIALLPSFPFWCFFTKHDYSVDNAVTVHVHDDKYADGIYLLYPRNATAAQVFVDFNL
jgi:hypothetical protein